MLLILERDCEWNPDEFHGLPKCETYVDSAVHEYATFLPTLRSLLRIAANRDKNVMPIILYLYNLGVDMMTCPGRYTNDATFFAFQHRVLRDNSNDHKSTRGAETLD